MAPISRKRKAVVRYQRRIKKKIRKNYQSTRGMMTPSRRGGQVYPTPPSTGRRAYEIGSQLAAAGASFFGGPVAGMATEGALAGAGYAYDLYSGKSIKKGYPPGSVTAMGGKPSKAYTKKIFPKKKKKNPSIRDIQKRGITLCVESRKTAATSNAEALAIGHTTMPAKICAINLWRAILKHLLLKTGVFIKDYGILATNADFTVNDAIRINRYLSGIVTSTTPVSVSITATMTLDEIAARFADIFDNASSNGDDRWDSIEIVPTTGSKMPATNVQLNLLKVSVFTKSELKIQNTTTENDVDNEADDVTRVPLQGKTYGVRGNNFCKKDNGPQLVGFFNTSNEEAIYGAWTKQISAELGTTSVDFYSNATGPSNCDQTTFLKPAEPPRQYEIQNCTSMGQLYIAPGEIKKSSLVQKYTFSVPFYLQMLYGSENTVTDRIVYNEKMGKAQVMYVEKIVGRNPTAANGVKLWVELEFRQSVLIHGPVQQFTSPITFQRDY